MAPHKRGRKGKQGNKQAAIYASSAAASASKDDASTAAKDSAEAQKQQQQPPALILTSDKRRGVYECDYCGTDISQTPRVRCAVCDDFDLCCDCLLAAGKLKQHDPVTHGYRVCDSCRYPLFPINKWAAAAAAASTNNNNNNTSSATSALQKKDSTVASVASKNEDAVSASGKSSEDDAMEGVEKEKDSDDNEKKEAPSKSQAEDSLTVTKPAATEQDRASVASSSVIVQATDDPKTSWTAEEDLRLLRGIQTHGLGNWPDIAEAVAGQGSTGKTAKRCMERYFDDFLGRYGHILPPLTLISENEPETTTASTSATTNTTNTTASTTENNEQPKDMPPPPSIPTEANKQPEEQQQTEATRSSKRRSALMRSPSSVSNATDYGGGGSSSSRKKYKAVPTESIPEYQELWPKPFLPQREDKNGAELPVEYGQEVGRDQATRQELAFVRAIASMDNKEQIERVRKDWEQNRLLKPGGPTVLPMRSDDVPTLPGSELIGFMPRRGDFDVEWANDAEQAVADMEFIAGESEQDRKLKLQVLSIYNSKLDEREKRKQFVMSRKLYDYRKRQEELQKLPRDERDLVHRMRLFERFHTPAEHEVFIADLLKAKRLRKEIAKLQMYRRMGIRTLVEAERYELDKSRRHFHRAAVAQKQAEAKQAEAATGGTGVDASAKAGSGGTAAAEDDSSSVYWKQYRTTDRKVRRSINRGEPSSMQEGEAKAAPAEAEGAGKTDESAEVAKPAGSNAMDVDTPEQKSDINNKDTSGEKEKCDDKNKDKDSEAMDVDDDRKQSPLREKAVVDGNEEDEMSKLPGYKLLSKREVALCRSVSLLPNQYLEIKKALIHEALTQGLLDDRNNNNISKGRGASAGGSRRSLSAGVRKTLVKIDVERRGAVVDFVVRAGWISTGVGEAVRSGL